MGRLDLIFAVWGLRDFQDAIDRVRRAISDLGDACWAAIHRNRDHVGPKCPTKNCQWEHGIPEGG